LAEAVATLSFVSRGVLFDDGHLGDYLDEVRARAVEMAGSLPDEALAGRDDAEIAAELAERFQIEPPELHRDRAEFSQREIQIDVSGDNLRAIFDRSQPFYVKGECWTLHVPYTGDAKMFKLRPSRFLMTTFFGSLRSSELLVSFEFPDGREVDVEAETFSQVDKIEQVLGHARNDIEGFSARLPGEIAAALTRRRAEIARHNERLAAMKTPIRRDPEPESRPAHTVRRRRPRPSAPATASGATPSAKARATLAGEYEHILEVLRTYARSMERTPSSFATTEEGRRDALLGALATHYRGQAFAEAFNRRGKTDILLREDDHNLFICECKIWDGPSKFAEALDQLLSYATWHDTRLSVVVFVEQRDLSRVIGGAREVLERHESFGGWRGADSETELRCEMKFPGDAAQRLQLAVLFVHLVP
jgi:hypothetical protein